MLQYFLYIVYFLLPVVGSDSGYISCIPGTLNVIVAAPHGGYEEPMDIPDREPGCYNQSTDQCIWTHGCGVQNEDNCDVNNVHDAFTKELTELLADDLENLTSKRPYVVINNLLRKKLDANREIGEAALGHVTAEEAYNEFQQCIEEARAAIEADECVNGTGLFLDIHGHGHPNNWAELGYLIYGSRLDSGSFDVEDISIKYLLQRSSLALETILRGSQSFGHFLEEEGYISVPSPTHTGPSGESYFSGGYNTKTHGSRDGGSIDAIQIESSRTNRELPERTEYAAALAQTVVNFLDAHYTSCNTAEGGSSTDSSNNMGTSMETGHLTDDSTETKPVTDMISPRTSTESLGILFTGSILLLISCYAMCLFI